MDKGSILMWKHRNAVWDLTCDEKCITAPSIKRIQNDRDIKSVADLIGKYCWWLLLSIASKLLLESWTIVMKWSLVMLHVRIRMSVYMYVCFLMNIKNVYWMRIIEFRFLYFSVFLFFLMRHCHLISVFQINLCDKATI